jgi:hypothetical protein
VIADCNDITDCLVCTAQAAEDQAMALYYRYSYAEPRGGLPSTGDLNKCQREIGQRSVKSFRYKLKLLAKCERKVMGGDIPGPCPDAKSQTKIDSAKSKNAAKICARCGGDDFTPAAIGFATACPDVTVPGGAVCGGAISTLDDIVARVGCVTEFKVDCLEALPVPAVKSYPGECNPPP